MNKYNFKEFLSRFMNDVDDHELFEVLKGIPELNPNEVWLAGGAIRRTLIGDELNSDFDLFFKNQAALKQYAKKLEDKKARKTAETEHHITYCLNIKDKPRIIQLIKIGYYE